ATRRPSDRRAAGCGLACGPPARPQPVKPVTFTRNRASSRIRRDGETASARGRPPPVPPPPRRPPRPAPPRRSGPLGIGAAVPRFSGSDDTRRVDPETTSQEQAMSIQAVAERFVELCNQGKNFEVMETL